NISLIFTRIYLQALSQTYASILNSSWREAARIDQENRRAGRDPHSTRWQTRLVSEPDDEGVPAGSSTQRNQPEPRAQYFKKAGEIVNLDELGKFLCRAEEMQRLQGCCRLRDRRLAPDPNCDADISVARNPYLDCSSGHCADRNLLS